MSKTENQHRQIAGNYLNKRAKASPREIARHSHAAKGTFADLFSASEGAFTRAQWVTFLSIISTAAATTQYTSSQDSHNNPAAANGAANRLQRRNVAQANVNSVGQWVTSVNQPTRLNLLDQLHQQPDTTPRFVNQLVVEQDTSNHNRVTNFTLLNAVSGQAQFASNDTGLVPFQVQVTLCCINQLDFQQLFRGSVSVLPSSFTPPHIANERLILNETINSVIDPLRTARLARPAEPLRLFNFTQGKFTQIERDNIHANRLSVTPQPEYVGADQITAWAINDAEWIQKFNISFQFLNVNAAPTVENIFPQFFVPRHTWQDLDVIQQGGVKDPDNDPLTLHLNKTLTDAPRVGLIDDKVLFSSPNDTRKKENLVAFATDPQGEKTPIFRPGITLYDGPALDDHYDPKQPQAVALPLTISTKIGEPIFLDLVSRNQPVSQDRPLQPYNCTQQTTFSCHLYSGDSPQYKALARLLPAPDAVGTFTGHYCLTDLQGSVACNTLSLTTNPLATTAGPTSTAPTYTTYCVTLPHTPSNIPHLGVLIECYSRITPSPTMPTTLAPNASPNIQDINAIVLNSGVATPLYPLSLSSDPDGDALNITSVSALDPSHAGNIMRFNDTVLTYLPQGDFSVNIAARYRYYNTAHDDLHDRTPNDHT